MTQLEIILYQNEAIKQEVISFLDWNNDDYCQFQEEMGYLYLQKEKSVDKALFNVLIRSKMFWSWWINHWVKRDVDFLRFKDSLKEETRVVNYRLQHRPASILFEPHRAILRKSYRNLISNLKAVAE